MLEVLDLNNNTALITLYSYDNQIEYLDIRNKSLLRDLIVHKNCINEIDIDTNNSLLRVDLRENQLNAENLNDIFISLNDITHLPNTSFSSGIISISGNIGQYECEKSIAENKGWRVSDSRFIGFDKEIENLIKNNKDIWRNHEENYN
jgi:hypothetical protein